jgi:hypothetical protein
VPTPDQTRKMNEVYESWDFFLHEKLEAADRIAAKMYQEMGLVGVPAADRSEYIGSKILAMIEKIAAERKVR